MVKPLTIKQKKFVNALVQDPTSATKAAMKAGYSPRSARVTASRLRRNERVQSAIEQHFMDRQEYVNQILDDTLKHIKNVLNDEDEPAKEKTKAAKVGLEYTRLAANILGFDVKKKPAPFEEVEAMTAEELKRYLLIELDAVEKLLKDQQPRGTPPKEPKLVTLVDEREGRTTTASGNGAPVLTPQRTPAETSYEADVADATGAQVVPGTDSLPSAQGQREKHPRVAPDLNKTRLGSYVSDFPLTRLAR